MREKTGAAEGEEPDGAAFHATQPRISDSAAATGIPRADSLAASSINLMYSASMAEGDDMARILLNLAACNFTALLAAFGFGVLSWARGGQHDESVTSYVWHLYVALFAIIFNLGLHCLVFIYFLGTGRWVKEVAIAYQLPDEPLPKLTRELKRGTFPPALFAMLVPIAAGAAGMANIHQLMSWTANLHFALAVVTLLINIWALRIEYRNVSTNAGVIDQVMAEVERIRAEKGLPPSAEAWNQPDPV